MRGRYVVRSAAVPFPYAKVGTEPVVMVMYCRFCPQIEYRMLMQKRVISSLFKSFISRLSDTVGVHQSTSQLTYNIKNKLKYN